MTPSIAFGTTLRRVRRQKKISQEKLALNTGLDRTYISLLERGLRQPTLKTILSISQALDMTSSQLIENIEALIDEN